MFARTSPPVIPRKPPVGVFDMVWPTEETRGSYLQRNDKRGRWTSCLQVVTERKLVLLLVARNCKTRRYHMGRTKSCLWPQLFSSTSGGQPIAPLSLRADRSSTILFTRARVATPSSWSCIFQTTDRRLRGPWYTKRLPVDGGSVGSNPLGPSCLVGSGTSPVFVILLSTTQLNSA